MWSCLMLALPFCGARGGGAAKAAVVGMALSSALWAHAASVQLVAVPSSWRVETYPGVAGAGNVLLIGYIATQRRDAASKGGPQALGKLLAFHFFSGGKYQVAAQVRECRRDRLGELAMSARYESDASVHAEQF